jgi:hypothetical protein
MSDNPTQGTIFIAVDGEVTAEKIAQAMEDYDAEQKQAVLAIRKTEYTIVTADDLPTHGNANHVYGVSAFNGDQSIRLATINFQNGPIQEHGVNGIQMEDLLAICAHRLRGFQAGPFACNSNEQALQHIVSALHWLDARTQDRKQRGVEGTNQQ